MSERTMHASHKWAPIDFAGITEGQACEHCHVARGAAGATEPCPVAARAETAAPAAAVRSDRTEQRYGRGAGGTRSVMGLYLDVVEKQLHNYHVPAHLRAGLIRYLFDGIRPGGFLVAVLENNLREAIQRGAPDAIIGLPNVVTFLNMEAPRPAWGSREAVDAWIGGGAREAKAAL